MGRLHARIGTIRQLEILIAVYEHRSITAAAKVLHLTQPTLSMQLRKLADSVGTPLYSQIGKRLVFTEAGEAAVKTAREVLESFDRLEMRLADLQGMKAGTLRLAAVTTAKYLVPHLLGDFVHEYPGVEVDFDIGNRRQMLASLAEGLSDFFVFSHPPEDAEMELHRFAPNHLVPVVSQDHPLPSDRLISLERFAQEPYLARESGSGTQFAIDKHCRNQGISLNVRMTVASNEAIKHCVMSGLGVSILPRHSLVLGGAEGLRELQVEHLPIEAEWYLAYLKGKQLSVVAQTFLDYVLAQTHSVEVMLESAFIPKR